MSESANDSSQESGTAAAEHPPTLDEVLSQALAKALALLTCDKIPSRSWRQALHDHAIAQHAATPARFGAWQAACQNLLTAQERFTCLRSLAPCDAAAPIPHGSHEYDVLTWLR